MSHHILRFLIDIFLRCIYPFICVAAWVERMYCGQPPEWPSCDIPYRDDSDEVIEMFNRILAIRRLKWRFLVTGKALWGSVSPANQALLASQTGQNALFQELRAPARTPYVEVGYGIDNIFRIFRVDAVHRLTYRSNPDAQQFGIRLSAWVNL